MSHGRDGSRDMRRSISETLKDNAHPERDDRNRASTTNSLARSTSENANTKVTDPKPAGSRRRSWLFSSKSKQTDNHPPPTRTRSSTASNKDASEADRPKAKSSRRSSMAVGGKKSGFHSYEVEHHARNSRKISNLRPRNEWKQFIDEITESEHGFDADADLEVKCQGYLGKLNREQGRYFQLAGPAGQQILRYFHTEREARKLRNVKGAIDMRDLTDIRIKTLVNQANPSTPVTGYAAELMFEHRGLPRSVRLQFAVLQKDKWVGAFAPYLEGKGSIVEVESFKEADKDDEHHGSAHAHAGLDLDEDAKEVRVSSGEESSDSSGSSDEDGSKGAGRRRDSSQGGYDRRQHPLYKNRKATRSSRSLFSNNSTTTPRGGLPMSRNGLPLPLHPDLSRTISNSSSMSSSSSSSSGGSSSSSSSSIAGYVGVGGMGGGPPPLEHTHRDSFASPVNKSGSYETEIRRLVLLSELLLRSANLTKRLVLKRWRAIAAAATAAAISSLVKVEGVGGKTSVVKFRSFTKMKKVEIFKFN